MCLLSIQKSEKRNDWSENNSYILDINIIVYCNLQCGPKCNNIKCCCCTKYLVLVSIKYKLMYLVIMERNVTTVIGLQFQSLVFSRLGEILISKQINTSRIRLNKKKDQCFEIQVQPKLSHLSMQAHVCDIIHTTYTLY